LTATANITIYGVVLPEFLPGFVVAPADLCREISRKARKPGVAMIPAADQILHAWGTSDSLRTLASKYAWLVLEIVDPEFTDRKTQKKIKQREGAFRLAVNQYVQRINDDLKRWLDSDAWEGLQAELACCEGAEGIQRLLQRHAKLARKRK